MVYTLMIDPKRLRLDDPVASTHSTKSLTNYIVNFIPVTADKVDPSRCCLSK